MGKLCRGAHSDEPEIFSSPCSLAVRAPVLLLLAEHDRVIDNARTRTFIEQLATPDRQIIEYPGAHHTLEFEPDSELFLTDLLRWLDRQTQARRPPG